ncbi:Glucan 1,3-beta-glucosidase [Mycena venus]|uniref:Glucan 1,3-beta-glucosidase n=1 Tax=Mycena venus TaxID=2733690 RepID=A0A8H6X7K9_9AGAR|nr:Glucan 1,3-beta-glucosidase [Mycena venus]
MAKMQSDRLRARSRIKDMLAVDTTVTPQSDPGYSHSGSDCAFSLQCGSVSNEAQDRCIATDPESRNKLRLMKSNAFSPTESIGQQAPLIASNSFSTPPLSHVTTLDNASSGPPKRMASTALPPAAPYAAVAKPWTQSSTPPPPSTTSPVLLLVPKRLHRPHALVFSEDFNVGDDAAMFGSDGIPGRWLREDGAPFPDGTTYNATDCTFNITAPNGGFNAGPTGTDFDWSGYFTCSHTTNSTAGTIINPVQSARVSTLLSAKNGNETTLQLTRGSIRYGKVEVRAKMPTGDWLWPAIWMLPVPGSDGQGAYGAWPRSGEIDLVESRWNGICYTNSGSNYVQGALNWGPTPRLNGVGKSYSWWTDRRTPVSNDFHTYTMEWTDKWLRISLDTRLHTLLDMQFNEPFWQRRDFPKTITGPDGRLEALQDPWANATNKNTAPFDQGA